MSHSTENTSRTPPRGPYRIALCITELDIGGAEQQFVRLATGLDRNLFEPHVFCLASEGPLAEPLRQAGIPVTFLNVRSRWDLGVIRRLAAELRQLRPELIQTFLFHANIAGRLAAWRAGVPHVVSGIRVAERRRWQLQLDRLTERLVDRHVCVSEAVARHCREIAGLDSRKIVVIPNGIDADRFANAPPSPLPGRHTGDHSPLILFVGRLEPQKDPELLIEAFRQLSTSYPRARLALAGAGSLKETLHRQTRDLGDRVLWLGQRDDVPGLMRTATCLALPSRWEGMPNVIMEAMAAGLPVVACAAEGVCELLREGKYGEVVRERSPAALAAALQRVLDDEPAARRKAELSKQFVIKELATSKTVRSYQKLYFDLLKAPACDLRELSNSPPRPPNEKNRENLQSQPG